MMTAAHRFWLCCLLALSSVPASVPAQGVIDVHAFPNEELRGRYNRLIYELRCPQCLNTNIAGSDARISGDLRREVHRLLLEGRSDEEILAFMQSRYGDFILYRPPLTRATLAIWLGPVLLLLLGLSWLLLLLLRHGGGPARLSEADRRQLDELLGDDGRKESGT